MNERLKNFVITPIIMLLISAFVAYEVGIYSSETGGLFFRLIQFANNNKFGSILFLLFALFLVFWHTFSMRSYVPIMATGIIAGQVYKNTGNVLASIGVGLIFYFGSISIGKNYILTFVAACGTAYIEAYAIGSLFSAFGNYIPPELAIVLVISYFLIAIVGIIIHNKKGDESSLIFNGYYSSINPSESTPLSEPEGIYKLSLSIASIIIVLIFIFVNRGDIALLIQSILPSLAEAIVFIPEAAGYLIVLLILGARTTYVVYEYHY